MTNSRLTDPEVLEWRFPVRLESFAMRRGSGGAGAHRGGDGAIRRVRFLEPMTAVMLANHRRIAPFGVAGGSPGALGRNWVERVDGSRENYGATFQVEMNAGDVLSSRRQGAVGGVRPRIKGSDPWCQRPFTNGASCVDWPVNQDKHRMGMGCVALTTKPPTL
jgi:N-methylhydantoinase B/oxoprolinase/acetone carboxylase alpha subunit